MVIELVSTIIFFLLAYFLAYQKASNIETIIKQNQANTSHKVAKKVLFVTAHPDDECMFFTPTIEAMKKESDLYILVLSNGGYDGLGKIRQKEME